MANTKLENNQDFPSKKSSSVSGFAHLYGCSSWAKLVGRNRLTWSGLSAAGSIAWVPVILG